MARRVIPTLRAWVLLGALGALAPPARGFDEAAAERALAFARRQLEHTATDPAVPPTQSPKSSLGGPWKRVANTDRVGWTQGFFPGLLWFMHEPGREAVWRTRADTWTRPLEVQKGNRETHDLGFKFMPSYGHAYRLTGDPYYRDVLLEAARSLASRYHPEVGAIDCCDWNDPPWRVATVTDTLVDLELLFWAARNGGDPAWNDLALQHALTAARDMVRPDGGTWHVVDYDDTGRVRSKETFQGYADDSTWSRGQAWAVYGFTMAYRYTRDPRMLQAARKVTDSYLARLPADAVPPWDFDAPPSQQQKDSSAAAIAASALQELSTYATSTAEARRYREAALAMLDSLASPAYLAEGTSNPGILLHGTAFYRTPLKPSGDDIDASLIYGDYYFVEALGRFQRAAAGGWLSALAFPGAPHALGTSHTGVRVVDFDVTPLSQPIDGVIGYADSATTITGYTDLALAVRLNAEGLVDARRGDAYGALAAVPYTAHRPLHVRLWVDLPARTYSVWVTPQGEAEILLAERFPFRADAPPTDDLGQVAFKSERFDEAYRVNNHTVRAPTPQELLDGRPATEQPAPPDATAPLAEPPGRAGMGCQAGTGALLGLLGLVPWLARRRRAR
ncbi:glycoside hydrolase family 88 protein [Archangium primigenium]|uniref:glycoside hydrolase family 88 protein n=1 Tax=[Archangium] primigenium TaxID=2792470 RepID=UPI00195BA00E|nr:glycoside hydrolase family 88 protein [Archangium primigenium]MBM7113525.1 glycoside hydrolase family 88 protein [Archangium primigenium]